jgi:hypothetical protein
MNKGLIIGLAVGFMVGAVVGKSTSIYRLDSKGFRINTLTGTTWIIYYDSSTDQRSWKKIDE